MRKLLILLSILLAAPVAVAEFRIEGISGSLEQNVRAFVDLGREPCDAPQWRVRRRFRAATRQATAALEPYGYYAPTIDSELAFREDCWHATLGIDPGPRVLFRNVDIAVTGPGAGDPAFSASTVPLSLAAGQPLLHEAYENYKQSLQVRAAERGYVEAALTEHRLDVWPGELAADVTLHFATGPRYRFGEVAVEQRVVEESLVDRYLRIPVGEPYDGAIITEAYTALSNSGYFGRIQITPDFEDATDLRIPVTVSLEPATRIEYTVGAGYATDTGVRFRAGVRNQRVNREGHRFDARLSASSVRSGLTTEYRMPLDNPRTEWMSYTAGIEAEETDTADSELARVGVLRTRQLTTNWLGTASLDFDYERFIVGTVDDSSRLLVPAVAIDHKRSDRDLHPNRGRRIGAELRGTHRSIGSTTSFLQLVAHARYIRSIGGNGRWIARLHAGITARSEFDELPPSVRFFAGGDESVRGFGYKTLGPEDEEGNVIGGSRLLVGSLEYEHRLKGNFYGAVFADAGNAFEGTDIDPAVGAGLGIKWRSPIGPVRLYLARPLNKSDDNLRFHVSLGADL